mgnify:CR=1 FL=1
MESARVMLFVTCRHVSSFTHDNIQVNAAFYAELAFGVCSREWYNLYFIYRNCYNHDFFSHYSNDKSMTKIKTIVKNAILKCKGCKDDDVFEKFYQSIKSNKSIEAAEKAFFELSE